MGGRSLLTLTKTQAEIFIDHTDVQIFDENENGFDAKDEVNIFYYDSGRYIPITKSSDIKKLERKLGIGSWEGKKIPFIAYAVKLLEAEEDAKVGNVEGVLFDVTEAQE